MPNSPSAWDSPVLREQLALQQITSGTDVAAIVAQLEMSQADTTRLHFSISGLADYAASWGDKAAVWLVLAVLKLIRDVTADYTQTTIGCIPPDQFVVWMREEDYQEIAHRCLTGYQELYDVLLRTHRKPSSPIWHRRAVVQHFPQLQVENDDKGDLISNNDLTDHTNGSA